MGSVKKKNNNVAQEAWDVLVMHMKKKKWF